VSKPVEDLKKKVVMLQLKVKVKVKVKKR